MNFGIVFILQLIKTMAQMPMDRLNRPGGGGGKRYSMGKFLKPTFVAQFWGADYENLCYMAIYGGV